MKKYNLPKDMVEFLTPTFEKQLRLAVSNQKLIGATGSQTAHKTHRIFNMKCAHGFNHSFILNWN